MAFKYNDRITFMILNEKKQLILILTLPVKFHNKYYNKFGANL